MERIQIYFHNCDIDSDEKSRIKADIGSQLSKAPSDASTCCCITQKEDQFVCNMRVHSARGHLHIHRESKTMETLLDFLYDSLKRSLKQWHQNPDNFKKNHPLGQTPCRDHDHKVVTCPYKSFANKNFET